MDDEIIICIPGTWESRNKFIESVVVSTRGEFMFAGMLLAHPTGKDYVELEFYDADQQMAEAFEFGGQGKITAITLGKIGQHQSVVYLHFLFDIISQKERIVKFTEVLSRCGGIAVKLENPGIAHEWESWFEMLRSDNPVDTYRAGVLLFGDEKFYYSCGMHNFNLPDAQVSNRFDAVEGAELINRFNYWQIVEKPVVKDGHTFSLTADSPHFRLGLSKDKRHPEDNLLHNPNGLWELSRI